MYSDTFKFNFMAEHIVNFNEHFEYSGIQLLDAGGFLKTFTIQHDGDINIASTEIFNRLIDIAIADDDFEKLLSYE